MSVDIALPFPSPPLKRPREIPSLFPNNGSKCGEIFVTSNGEKWTFLCGYCQEFTGDVGAFICHIRLEHLNSYTDSAQQPQNQQNPAAESNDSTTIARSSQADTNQIGFMPTIQIADALCTEELQPQSEIIKEETIASTREDFETICFKVSKIVDITSSTQPESDDTENFNANKNFIATPHDTSAKNKDVFTITPIYKQGLSSQTRELNSEIDNKGVVKVENEAADNTKYNDANTEISEKEQDDDDDSKTSCYFPSEDDVDSDNTDFEIDDGNKASGSSKPEKEELSADSDLPRYKCPYCPKRVSNENARRQHILCYHQNKLTIKCKHCNRGFQSKQGLHLHLNSHYEKGHGKNRRRRIEYVPVFKPCPVCGTKYSEGKFITHVLKHESDTCFPCQVCGKLYDSNVERIEHWETHAEEKPFYCTLCYRRFHNPGNMARHKQSIHRIYRCTVCVAEFNTIKKQKLPYVCISCRKPRTDSNENVSATPQPTSAENFGEVFTITPIHSEAQTQELSSEIDNKEVVQVVYVQNDKDNVDSNERDFEINSGNRASDSSKPSELPDYKCLYCSRRYTCKIARRNHILNHHHNKLTIKCKKCNRGFHSKHGLNLHLKSHYETGHVKVQCPVCATKYSEAKFITHVLTHESETCFPCQVCGKLYASNVERIEHWETHAEEKPFHCPICYRRFSNNGMLESHLRTHRQYRCSVCAAEFNTTEKQEPPYVCKACEKSGTNKEAITKLEYDSDGAASKQIVLDITNDDSNTQCTYTLNDTDGDEVSNQDDSDVEFIDESYDDNIASGSASANTCETLQTETTSQVDENCLHDEKYESSSKYKCKLCDKVYKTRWGLSTHKDTHKQHKIYQCPLCPKTEHKEVNFVDHVLRHENESCFPCQVCGKLFDTNAERVKHWETHIAERPYGCDICFRRYRNIGVLNIHMKSHGLR